jgi:FMN phosphatase YigB (HAD superfamily)
MNTTHTLPKELKAIFFDLDGTLIGVHEAKLAETLMSVYQIYWNDKIPNPKTLEQAVLAGVMSVVKHKGVYKSEIPLIEQFFITFKEVTGFDRDVAYELFSKAYESKDFDDVVKVCELYEEESKQVIRSAKSLGLKLVLATNPVFPFIATKKRLEWIGINCNEFDFITHGENYHICKPHPTYFTDLLNVLNQENSSEPIKPEQVLMVGNDYYYDMAASAVGMKTWFVGVANTYEGHPEAKGKFKIDYQGSLHELIQALEQLKNV